MKTATNTILAGIGATLATDIWSLILKLSGVHSQGLVLVGSWITSHLEGSLQSLLWGRELTIGWIAHYCLGVSFGFLLIPMFGKEWFRNFTISKSLVLGILTFIISLLVIQPVLGFGIAFCKMPNQYIIILKVFVFHVVYSIGIYLSTTLLNTIQDKSNIKMPLTNNLLKNKKL